MVTKYIFGNPINTEAIINETDICLKDSSEISFLTAKDSNHFFYKLKESDIVYGLGEQIRGINKRGWQYVSWNYDNPHHQEDTRSLYGSHNFIIVSGEKNFGVFFDYPGKMTFDIGYTAYDEMKISAADGNIAIYIIEPDKKSDSKPDSSFITESNQYSDKDSSQDSTCTPITNAASLKDIVKQFRQLIGKSYVPPFWAFGYGQSRWGYKNEADIREVANHYREAGIPIDSIYMDIDYMEDYKDFTVNKERFPNLKSLATDMINSGIHLVPIIDAGVKIEKDYDIYEEGVANNYFCKNENGEDFVGAVWPGRVHFPDFLNPDTRKWFGDRYKVLTDLGIDGFWNDMNEPAIFYTEDRLADTLAKVEELTSGNMGISEYFAFTGMVGGLNGNEGDYDKFYHKLEGQMVQHSRVHNLYGMNMTRAANEALECICPDKRILFFSRSSYIGAHRYGGIWQGDNKSWWSHILQSMQQLPALNMAGFLYVGADTGGFGCDTTEDLMLRWLQYSLFTPLFRNHSCDGTRFQELYRFSKVKAMGEMVKIRYSLIPYLYSEYMKAVDGNEMMFRPLSFEFEDEQSKQTEDQLLLGNELMIAPIYKQNAKGRYVYLPEEMMLVTMRSWNDYRTEILPAGHHYVKADLEELIFFVRKDKAIPLYATADNTEQIDLMLTKC